MIKKMNNSEIIARINGINKMQERDKANNLHLFGENMRVLYGIFKNKQTLIEHLKPYNDALSSLVEECGVKFNDGDLGREIEVPEENKLKWVSSIDKLQKIIVDVPVFQVELKDIEDANFTMEDFEIIGFMISDPE